MPARIIHALQRGLYGFLTACGNQDDDYTEISTDLKHINCPHCREALRRQDEKARRKCSG